MSDLTDIYAVVVFRSWADHSVVGVIETTSKGIAEGIARVSNRPDVYASVVSGLSLTAMGTLASAMRDLCPQPV